MARPGPLLCLVLALLLPGPALAFTLGVLPIHGARVLVERYEPLRAYLERSLKQPVRIESAPDFARFQQRTLRGEFDLAVTPAHFARIAQKDLGFQPLIHLLPDHDALLVFSADQPLAALAELKGRQIAVVDRLAVTVMAALQYLEEQGLESGRDYAVAEHRTHASVAHALAGGLSAVGVTTSQGMQQIPQELRQRLVVQKHIANIPAFVFLAGPDLAKARVEGLRALLLDFAKSPEGAAFMKQTGYNALRPVTEAFMKRADPYLKETRRTLAP
jgi:phosphonate transport system substrate-binding protein